ncbi:MAG TPA: hypothetical protein VGK53_08875 [Propionicimonas sp.]|jgi:hypothetical protein
MMTDDPTVEVARLFDLLGEEPEAIRTLADTTATLQAIQAAKRRLALLPSSALRAGLRKRSEELRP